MTRAKAPASRRPTDRAHADEPAYEPDRTTAREMRIAELLAVMLPWDPKERGGAIKAWLRGSLSLIHLHVLTSLETSGPIPMGRLADTLDVSVASTTGIVNRMEERGLVERRHDDVDRRIVSVTVTPAGHDVFTTVDTERRAHFARVLERLTDAELEHLLIGLRATRSARASIAAEEAAAAADPASEEPAR